MTVPSPSYVLCNWNDHALAVVIQLQSRLLRAQGETWIQVIDPNPPAPEALPAAYTEFLQYVRFTRGHPGDPKVLASMDLSSVRCVILLASSKDGQGADAETLLTMEALRVARERTGSAFRALAEIVVPEHRTFLEQRDGVRADWLEVLSAGEVEAHIFSQAVRVYGLTRLYFDLLSFSDESNEAYRVPVPPSLVGAAFSEAWMALRGTMGTGQRLLAVGVARGGAGRIETNPDDSHPLAPEDELVVLSYEPPLRPPLGGSGEEYSS